MEQWFSSIFDKAHYDFSEIPPALLTPQEANAFYQVCISGCSAAEAAQKRGGNKAKRQSGQTESHIIVESLEKIKSE